MVSCVVSDPAGFVMVMLYTVPCRFFSEGAPLMMPVVGWKYSPAGSEGVIWMLWISAPNSVGLMMLISTFFSSVTFVTG